MKELTCLSLIVLFASSTFGAVRTAQTPGRKSTWGGFSETHGRTSNLRDLTKLPLKVKDKLAKTGQRILRVDLARLPEKTRRALLKNKALVVRFVKDPRTKTMVAYVVVPYVALAATMSILGEAGALEGIWQSAAAAADPTRNPVWVDPTSLGFNAGFLNGQSADLTPYDVILTNDTLANEVIRGYNQFVAEHTSKAMPSLPYHSVFFSPPLVNEASAAVVPAPDPHGPGFQLGQNAAEQSRVHNIPYEKNPDKHDMHHILTKLYALALGSGHSSSLEVDGNQTRLDQLIEELQGN